MVWRLVAQAQYSTGRVDPHLLSPWDLWTTANFCRNLGRASFRRHFKYFPKKLPGTQYILDAADLSEIPDASYDFLLSSHMLDTAPTR